MAENNSTDINSRFIRPAQHLGNLFQPVGEKQLSYLVGEPITCPSPEQPFFFTNRNSRSDPKP